MNLLLLDPDELRPAGAAFARVSLGGRRARHLCRVLRVEKGDTVRVGVLGGGLGEARVVAAATGVEPGEDTVELVLEAEPRSEPPPPGPPLVLALPRPKVLRRLLATVASFGVDRLDLVNSWRVEKSYFDSPVLEPEAIRRQLLLGAEQGVTTRLPEVTVHRFFRAFLDQLEDQLGEDRPPNPRPALVAHPGVADDLATAPAELFTAPEEPILALGPEGGWIEREVESFERLGFHPVRLGPWILTVEAAVPVVLGQVAVRRRVGRQGQDGRMGQAGERRGRGRAR